MIYCGDCLDQLRKLPDACVDLIYIGPPFNSNRDYEVFWAMAEPRPPALDDAKRCQGSGSGPHRPFEDRHASTQAYIDYMRPRCVEPMLANAYRRIGGGGSGCVDGPAGCVILWLMPRSSMRERLVGILCARLAHGASERPTWQLTRQRVRI